MDAPRYYQMRLQICEKFIQKKYNLSKETLDSIFLSALNKASPDSFLDLFSTKKEALEYISSGSNEFVSGYRLEKTLGMGGQGIICLVEKDGQRYALKLMRVLTPQILTVLESLKDICQDGYVCVKETYFDPQGWGYYVMSYIDGMEVGSDKGSADASLLLDIAKKIRLLHQRGISHRDLKTENIIVKDNKAYIIDFDISTFEAESLELVGTPPDSSPEKIPLIMYGEKMKINKAVDDLRMLDKLNANNLLSYLKDPFFRPLIQREICDSKYDSKDVLEKIRKRAMNEILDKLTEKQERHALDIVEGKAHKYRIPEIRPIDLKKNDVWCLGLVFYAILTGNNLFTGSGWRQIIEHLEKWKKTDRRKVLSMIKDDRLREIVLKMLEPNPKSRWDIDKVVKELENCEEK